MKLKPTNCNSKNYAQSCNDLLEKKILQMLVIMFYTKDSIIQQVLYCTLLATYFKIMYLSCYHFAATEKLTFCSHCILFYRIPPAAHRCLRHMSILNITG